MTSKQTQIFPPANGFAPFTDPVVATDATVAKRDNRWWMYVAGKVLNREGIQIFSASLPEGAPLSAIGWSLTPDPNDKTKVAMLATQENSRPWDGPGGRHCPSYVKGWDPERGAWVERIYYAGGAAQVWGPYTIGYLEWNGEKWLDQPSPVFSANEDWEHGSVYEPNLVYHDGKWRMWYVAGSNHEDYLVHGYSESADGRTNWSKHKIFIPPDEKVFDFCVIETPQGFEAVFSRVWLAKSTPPSTTGLWWTHAASPSSDFADWSKPVQLMPGGPWKPSFRYSDDDPTRMFVFFDGIDRTSGVPWAFTSNCLELPRPSSTPFV